MKIKVQLIHHDETVTTIDLEQDLIDTVSIVEYDDKFFVYHSQGRFKPGFATFKWVSKPFKIES